MVTEPLTEEQRVALDTHGAEVVEIRKGVFEVWCASHATQLISDNRAYLEKRAATHNANWHPNLAPQSRNPYAAHARCVSCGAEIYRNYGWHHFAPSTCASPVPIERTFR